MAARAIPRTTIDLPLGWDEGRAGVLANVHCSKCIGLGWHPGRYRPAICNCVWREIFRQCFRAYRATRWEQAAARTSCALSHLFGPRGASRNWQYSRPQEEFLADFELIARRTLDERHLGIFRLHMLGDLGWRHCCRALRMDRGNFFHAVYRVEQALGKAYSGAEPYALFPVSRYFGSLSSDVMVMGWIKPNSN